MECTSQDRQATIPGMDADVQLSAISDESPSDLLQSEPARQPEPSTESTASRDNGLTPTTARTDECPQAVPPEEEHQEQVPPKTLCFGGDGEEQRPQTLKHDESTPPADQPNDLSREVHERPSESSYLGAPETDAPAEERSPFDIPLADLQRDYDEAGWQRFYSEQALEVLALFEDVRRHSEDVRRLAEFFAYRGFEPAALLRQLREKAGADLDADVRLMVKWNVRWGNNLHKIAKKLKTSEERDTLSRLIATYGLQSAVDSRATSVTLCRVAQVFPLLTCEFLNEAPKTFVPGSHMDGLLPSVTPPLMYPRPMMHMSFATMIPSTIITEETRLCLVDCHLLYQVVFSKRVGRSLEKKSNADRKALEELY